MQREVILTHKLIFRVKFTTKGMLKKILWFNEKEAVAFCLSQREVPLYNLSKRGWQWTEKQVWHAYIYKIIDRYVDRCIDRKTDKPTGRQTDRLTD